MNLRKNIYVLLLIINGLPAFSQPLPYPKSTVIKGIEIDWPTHQRHALGSDNFALTWADDAHLYGAWGDGGGFGGSNGKHRVSLGVARIEGDANSYKGVNRYGHADNSEVAATIKGKSWGIVSVAGNLYMWVHPDQPGGWGNWGEIAKEARLYRSADKGATWQAADWAFTKEEDGLVGGNILQYGRDYADSGGPAAPDGYVYHYFVKPSAIPDTAGRASELHKPGIVYLARVPREKLMQRQAYEFYAGKQGSKPAWTKDLQQKKAVFQDQNGVGMPIGISYNPGLKRYLLTTEHAFGERGNLGLFEGPTPWGPWATVEYFTQAAGTEFGRERAADVPPNTFYWAFPTKWMDATGREMTMTFTGAGRGKDNDSFNTVRVRLVTDAPPKPNFIVILTDDQRFDALSRNGNPAILTPNLDRLVRQGKNFTNAHVVFSLCSPSRAAILTGRYGSANGVLELNSKLNKGEKTVANYLRDAGYLTGVSGKWHVDQSPQELGFDFSTIFHGNGTYHGRKIYDQGKLVQPEEHCDLYCARRSIDFLEKAAARPEPFFLFHNTQLPHMDDKLEWPAPDSIRAKYQADAMPVATNRNDDLSDKPSYLKTVRNRTQAANYGYPDKGKIQAHTKDYYSVVTEMDAFVGDILKKVEALGVADHTYLIFMSDNGWMLGDHGFTSKVLPYLPSTHVPLAVVGPGIAPSTDPSLALNIDLLPTLLDLAGLAIPANIHGISLKSVLLGKEKRVRESFVYEGLGSYGGAEPNLTVVSGSYRYTVTYENNKLSQVNFRELYKIDTDPSEMKNLANNPAHSGRIAEFEKEIDRHIREVVASGTRRADR